MTRRDALAALSVVAAPLLATNSSNDVCYMRAVDMAAAIRSKNLSARELMAAHLRQIDRVNPKVNAFITLADEDKLMAQAGAADESLASGKWLGSLHGLHHRMGAFLSKYDLYPARQPGAAFRCKHALSSRNCGSQNGELHFLKSAYYISITGAPAMSVPCAFSTGGLPIGIQIVGRHHDEWGLLQLAYAFEQSTNVGARKPVVV